MRIYRDNTRVMFTFPTTSMVININTYVASTLGQLLQMEMMGSDSCAFDGELVHINSLGKLAYEKLLNVADVKKRFVHRYEQFLAEAFSLGNGFDIAIPHLDMAKIAQRPGVVNLKRLTLGVRGVSGAVATADTVTKGAQRISLRMAEYKVPDWVDRCNREAYLKGHDGSDCTAVAQWQAGMNVCTIPVVFNKALALKDIAEYANITAMNCVQLKKLVGGPVAAMIATTAITGSDAEHSAALNVAAASLQASFADILKMKTCNMNFSRLCDLSDAEWASFA